MLDNGSSIQYLYWVCTILSKYVPLGDNCSGEYCEMAFGGWSKAINGIVTLGLFSKTIIFGLFNFKSSFYLRCIKSEPFFAAD